MKDDSISLVKFRALSFLSHSTFSGLPIYFCLQTRPKQAIICEMSGFLFGFPSLRFLRRFRFFDTTVRSFAPWLLRWLSTRARNSREVISRLDEAEFPTASQSALLEWALDDWRAADGASTRCAPPIQ